MNVDMFCKRFVVGQSRSVRNKIKPLPPHNFTHFQPRLSSNKKSAQYEEFCKLSLVRYVPWQGLMSSVYGGPESTKERWKQLWEYHPANQDTSNEKHQVRDMNTILEQSQQDTNDLVGGGMYESEDEGEEIDESNQDLVDYEGMDDEEMEVRDWSKSLAEHPVTHNDMDHAGTFQDVKAKQEYTLEADVNMQERIIEGVPYSDLNPKQRNSFMISSTP